MSRVANICKLKLPFLKTFDKSSYTFLALASCSFLGVEIPKSRCES